MRRQVTVRILRHISSGRRRQRLLDREERIFHGRDSDPRALYDYDWAVNTAWLWSAIVFVLITGAAAFLGTLVDGSYGRRLGIAIAQGPTWFCIAGVGYTAWRCLWADAARRRFRRDGEQLTSPARRAMRRARLHNRSLIGQLAIAAIAVAIATP
jgi:hypothetical protein